MLMRLVKQVIISHQMEFDEALQMKELALVPFRLCFLHLPLFPSLTVLQPHCPFFFQCASVVTSLLGKMLSRSFPWFSLYTQSNASCAVRLSSLHGAKQALPFYHVCLPLVYFSLEGVTSTQVGTS